MAAVRLRLRRSRGHGGGCCSGTYPVAAAQDGRGSRALRWAPPAPAAPLPQHSAANGALDAMGPAVRH
jgi:hypothetical protein